MGEEYYYVFLLDFVDHSFLLNGLFHFSEDKQGCLLNLVFFS